MKYTTNSIENQINNTTDSCNSLNTVNSLSSSCSSSSASSTSSCLSSSSAAKGGTNTTNNTGAGAGSALFCEQVNAVTNLFDKWNDCERTVVMYALLKRLRYPSLKFLQYFIDNTLTQSMGSTSNISAVVVDMNANNPSYLQNLLNAYKTFNLGDMVDTLSSSSSDKDSILCYGSDFQLTHCDERKLYVKKEDILYEVLNMLPLLKPGNEETKVIYLSLLPLAVEDTMRQVVPTELVQQIFSYMLIHPAVSGDDRRNINVWLRHLEDHHNNFNICPSLNKSIPVANANYVHHPKSLISGLLPENQPMTNASSSKSSSTMSCSTSISNISIGSSSYGNLTQNCGAPSIANSSMGSRNNDWQTIQPPSKQQQQPPLVKPSVGSDWSSLGNTNNGHIGSGGDGGSIVVGPNIADQMCDNLNGITLNDMASSQNNLCIPIATVDGNSSSLVNGVAAAAASATAASVSTVTATPSMFGPQTNPIINIINNSNCDSLMNTIEDHDTSFSKNGTEIIDFEPDSITMNNCDNGSNTATTSNAIPIQSQPQLCYSSLSMVNCADQLDINRWTINNKFGALKTRRSNSLTTQAISSSASSSNSSVVTVNDNCSNSTENLAQFANKQRSFSLSIENHHSSLTNSGSDTRLDDFKPNYIKFQTRNVGMSSIGLWLKSLRLHKYIDLFKNMTYEDMLQISEEYLQSLGVTKGASHKLALCIEKLKDRSQNLIRMEQEIITGQLKLQAAIDELANIVLTPMKPIDLVNTTGEDNVALLFLKVVDLVCATAQREPYTVIDDDNVSILLWILDRSLHNEAFANHTHKLKESKLKVSKIKMTLTTKMLHHPKNGSSGNLNKPKWNGKGRKCDQKNGSNDRINHRKNSSDMLNFSLNSLHQQQINEYDKFHNGSNNNNNNTQYKNSAYQNYQQQQVKHQQQQQQIKPQMLQQHTHFPALPQQQQSQPNRRSLNNLIVISGGPQQPQKIIFKPGQGILSNTNMTSSDDITIDMMKTNQKQQQPRKASLTSINNNSINSSNNLNSSNMENLKQLQQQQSPAANSPMLQKNMTPVGTVSNDDLMHTAAAATASTTNVNVLVPPPPPPQILITHNNTHTQTNRNGILQQQQQQHHALQQQQQQLQLLAAAAAAVGNSCSLNITGFVSNCSSSNNTNNNTNVGLVVGSSNSSNIMLQQANNICSTTSNNNNSSNSNNLSSCSHCSNHLHINLKLPPLNENYQQHHHSPPAISDVLATSLNNLTDPLNDKTSLEQLETLCLQVTELAMN